MLIGAQRWREPHCFGYGMRRFERRQNAFGAAQRLKRRECFVVGRRNIASAFGFVQPGVFRANGGVIQPRRNAVGGGDLAFAILQHIRAGALKHAQPPARESRRVTTAGNAVSARFHAAQFHRFIGQKRVKHADGVGATADACDHNIGQFADCGQHLLAGFNANDALKIAYHQRIWVRPQRRTEQIIRIRIRHPIAHRLVDGILQGARTRGNAAHIRAQQPHPKHVRALAGDVVGAHIHHAFHAQQRADCRRCDSVLACAGFGDNPFFAHPLRQQTLTQRIIDFMCAGVGQILALQPNLRSTTFGRKASRVSHCGGATSVAVMQGGEFGLKGCIITNAQVGNGQFIYCGHQGFWHITATK